VGSGLAASLGEGVEEEVAVVVVTEDGFTAVAAGQDVIGGAGVLKPNLRRVRLKMSRNGSAGQDM
jgi:hypothetical protein